MREKPMNINNFDGSHPLMIMADLLLGGKVKKKGEFSNSEYLVDLLVGVINPGLALQINLPSFGMFWVWSMTNEFPGP